MLEERRRAVDQIHSMSRQRARICLNETAVAKPRVDKERNRCTSNEA